MSKDGSKPTTPVRRLAARSSVSRPVVTPIYPSVVYASTSPDQLDAQYEGGEFGFTYAREGHPNADLLATRIDQMEGGTGGVVTGSGMAAVTAAALGVLKSGDHILGGDQLYGRSLRLMAEDLPRFGIETSLADPTNRDALASAIRPNTRMILVEVVSNPTLRLADMEAIYELAKAHGLLVVVDNTFTTPSAYHPFAEGADIVVHSITKLLAGHSDVTLGYVAARDPQLAETIRSFAVTTGMTPSPNECWLAERGLYTFDLRYQKSCENAAYLAEFLSEQPGVKRVLYPGRSDHPDHARAKTLLNGAFGNMVSFEIAGGRAGANALVKAMPDLPFAPTLGDVGTTLSHPATSSHRALTPEAREKLGMSEGFFRISVGIEDIDLLKTDFAAGCAAAAKL